MWSGVKSGNRPAFLERDLVELSVDSNWQVWVRYCGGRKGSDGFLQCRKHYIQSILDGNGNKIILGVYAIREDADMITKEKFFTSLSTLIDEIGNSRELIITGDFNSRIGKQLNNRIVGPFGENVVNDNGERLIELCQHQSLKILNGFLNTRIYINLRDIKIHYNRSQL